MLAGMLAGVLAGMLSGVLKKDSLKFISKELIVEKTSCFMIFLY